MKGIKRMTNVYCDCEECDYNTKGCCEKDEIELDEIAQCLDMDEKLEQIEIKSEDLIRLTKTLTLLVVGQALMQKFDEGYEVNILIEKPKRDKK